MIKQMTSRIGREALEALRFVGIFILLAIASAGLGAVIVGCGKTIEYVYVPQEVKVAVEVPCNTKDVKKPDFYLSDKTLANENGSMKTRAAIGEIEQRRGYEKELKAANDACKAGKGADPAKEKPRP